jgi:membrane-anchored protein YejM (alkaline phosphatase superfamily)
VLSAIALLGAVFAGNLHPAGKQALYQILPESSILSRIKRQPTVFKDIPPEAKSGPKISPYSPGPIFQQLNVLVVMLESVPWSRVFGPKARPESIPNLQELAKEGIVFERAYATSTHSDYAQTSILASLHPRKFPHHDTFKDLSYPRTLFWDPLVPLGYRSAVFSCQNEHWGNMIAFLKTPHLQLLRHSLDWPTAPRRGSGTETKVFEEVPISEFFSWLDQAPNVSFAVYLNFQATHFPYVVPPNFPLLYSPSEIRFPATFLHYPEEAIPVMENRFYNALHYVDWAIGRLIAGLRARGLWEKTAILLVSDHGEAFYEHGLPTHGTTLFEEQVRTVLLLRVPQLTARVVREPVSVLDAVPTLYRTLGLPSHGNFQGRDDVLDPDYRGRDRALLMTIQGMTHEDGVLLGRFKLIRNWSRGDAAFFDLELDPEEKSNAFLVGHPAIPFLELRLRALLEMQLAYYRNRVWEEQLYPPRLP